MKPYFVIMNSRIGERKMAQIYEAFKRYFQAEEYEIHRTEYGGHAVELARKALASSAKVVVAAGGDGTVNEILQILTHQPMIMAILPCGSGNGLARHCGIPLKLNEAIATLKKSTPRHLDVGCVNGRYFISNAGVGFDAIVCSTIRESKSRGLAMYMRHVFRQYFRYRPGTYRIITDQHELNTPAYFLNAANGKEFGYGFEIASGASLQDGLLDLVIVKEMSFFKGLKLVIDGWRKKLESNSNCVFIKAAEIEIFASDMHYFQTDGDAHSCEGHCRLKLHPLSLQLLIPDGAKNI
jgi:YegS/Rv2252/BmrU family lipid kinase